MSSITGGYIAEVGTLPLNDQALLRFLHDVIVGVTGLDNTLVRPRFQRNPPPLPSIETDWCGFSVTTQQGDDNPYLESGDTSATMIRYDELSVFCVFSGDNCQGYAETLRDALYISQNREALLSAGMGLVGFSEVSRVPELINDRYFDRADITMTLRREIRREYPVFSFAKAVGTNYINSATEELTQNWETEE